MRFVLPLRMMIAKPSKPYYNPAGRILGYLHPYDCTGEEDADTADS